MDKNGYGRDLDLEKYISLISTFFINIIEKKSRIHGNLFRHFFWSEKQRISNWERHLRKKKDCIYNKDYIDLIFFFVHDRYEKSANESYFT